MDEENYFDDSWWNDSSAGDQTAVADAPVSEYVGDYSEAFGGNYDATQDQAPDAEGFIYYDDGSFLDTYTGDTFNADGEPVNYAAPDLAFGDEESYYGYGYSSDSPAGEGTYIDLSNGSIVTEQGDVLYTENSDGTYTNQANGTNIDFWGVLGGDNSSPFVVDQAAYNALKDPFAVNPASGRTQATNQATQGSGGTSNSGNSGGPPSSAVTAKPNTPVNTSTGSAPKKTVIADTRNGNDRVLQFSDGTRQVYAGYYAPKTSPVTSGAKPTTLGDVLGSATRVLGSVLSITGNQPSASVPRPVNTSASAVTGRIITTADGTTQYFDSSGKQISAAQYTAMQKAAAAKASASAPSPLILAALAGAAWLAFR